MLLVPELIYKHVIRHKVRKIFSIVLIFILGREKNAKSREKNLRR